MRKYQQQNIIIKLVVILASIVFIPAVSFCEEVPVFDFFETSDGLFYDNRALTEFTIHEHSGEYYVLVTYEENKERDIYRIKKEDLPYLELAISRKKFVFKKDGTFYRGRYALSYDKKLLIDGKTYARPILALEKPRAQLEELDEELKYYAIFQPESETYLNYGFISGYDYLITVDEFDSYKPITKKDTDSLISKIVTLDLGYSKTKALIVDVGKSRAAKNDVGVVDEVDGITSILFIPIPEGQNQLYADWYSREQLSMPIYSTSIFTVDDNYEIIPSNHDILTKYDLRGAFCYAPYSYTKPEFVKFRYNFIYIFKLFGSFSPSSREKLGSRKYIDLTDPEALTGYVTDIRDFLRGSSVKTLYLGTEVLATPFVDAEKNYTSWMSIDQPKLEIPAKCIDTFKN